MMIKHILVPLDFSSCAKHALKMALNMAKEWEGKLFLTHAIQIPESYMTIAGTYTPVDYQSLQEEESSNFKRLFEEIPDLQFVDHEIVKSPNDLIEGLTNTIQSKQIDLIVMGTKARHDRLERMLGTHAAEVIQSVNVPVLMVPDQFNIMGINKIGFATDGRNIGNGGKMGFVAALAGYTGASVEVFFVGKPGENIDFETSENKNLLERYLQDIEHDYFNVVNEKVPDGIVSFVDKHQIDMLVMIPRHHDMFYKWLHGSTTKSMAQNLNIPLFALPE